MDKLVNEWRGSGRSASVRTGVKEVLARFARQFNEANQDFTPVTFVQDAEFLSGHGWAMGTPRNRRGE